MYIGRTAVNSQRSIEVSVLVDGEPQPLYLRGWDNQIFVAGTPGEAFTLRVTNLRSGRQEIITTVDGRNTLVDEPGDAQKNQGLILNSQCVGCLDGWPQDDGELRPFIFGKPARIGGEPSDVGALGFAVHYEDGLSLGGGQRVPYSTMLSPGETDQAVTQWHRRRADPEVFVVRYETKKALRRIGLLVPPAPNAFPGNNDN